MHADGRLALGTPPLTPRRASSLASAAASSLLHASRARLSSARTADTTLSY